MIRYLVIVSVALIIFSCNSADYIPSNIIKPAQMENIFWDMMRGDILAQEIIKKDSIQTLKTANYTITEKIFAIHKTSREKFKESLDFYSRHPALLQIIFDSLHAVQERKNSFEIEKKIKPIKPYHFPHSKLVS